MKNSLLFSLRAILINIFSLFFEKKYLNGRYFMVTWGGFYWAWKAIWVRKILRLGRQYPWPVTLTCQISDPYKIHFHPDDLNNFQSGGTYFQNFAADISIGHGTYIAPNVGIITSNHDILNLDKHTMGLDVIIGEDCWIGMNSVILPGVVLGPRTIVAAGAVVNKSFTDGWVVIGGVPAKPLKTLIKPEHTINSKYAENN